VCTVSAETCDGFDENCNAIVDDGATCSEAGEVCDQGACVCAPANLCSGICVDKQTDPANCGGCETACTPEAACAGGTCVCPLDAPDTCAGHCVDKQTDPENCGACGLVAPAGASCVGGAPVWLNWANWPMPNPASSGLPNPTSYTVDAANGVVTDNVTALMWQRTVDPGFHTLAQAKQYCTELVLGGHSDWRAPTRIELVSLVDYTRTGPTIDIVAFPAAPTGYFWTSTLVAASPATGWRVGFTFGDTAQLDATATFRVRCVR
jgi:hypothetical protein